MVIIVPEVLFAPRIPPTPTVPVTESIPLIFPLLTQLDISAFPYASIPATFFETLTLPFISPLLIQFLIIRGFEVKFALHTIPPALLSDLIVALLIIFSTTTF